MRACLVPLDACGCGPVASTIAAPRFANFGASSCPGSLPSSAHSMRLAGLRPAALPVGDGRTDRQTGGGFCCYAGLYSLAKFVLRRGSCALVAISKPFLFCYSRRIDPWVWATVPRAPCCFPELQRRWVVVNLDGNGRWPCGDDSSLDVVGCQHVGAARRNCGPRYGSSDRGFLPLLVDLRRRQDLFRRVLLVLITRITGQGSSLGFWL